MDESNRPERKEMERQWNPHEEEVKQHFINARGAWKWSAMWDTILELDAEIVDAYADYSSVAEKREILDIKMRKLICVAIDSVTGCLNANGLKNHMKHSLQLGISVREILETLEITSMVGTCSYALGIPLLYEACRNRGIYLAAIELDDRQKALKKAYMDEHDGYWTEEKENILRLDPDYFETFSRFEDVPQKTGTLSPKEKELLYIAVHAAPVTLHESELKYHIEKALDCGATWKEIAEVFEIVSTLGIHAITMGVPILKEAINEVEAAK
jgi:alkylhydroperoxidase/carboxymuconolactone decarboxylase family protein YurZ